MFAFLKHVIILIRTQNKQNAGIFMNLCGCNPLHTPLSKSAQKRVREEKHPALPEHAPNLHTLCIRVISSPFFHLRIFKVVDIHQSQRRKVDVHGDQIPVVGI